MEKKIKSLKNLPIEDCKCTICFQFIIEPVQLECLHYFCFDCTKTLLNLNIIKCPVCRKIIKENNKILQINSEIENKIKKSFPDLFSKNLEELKKKKELEKNKKILFFRVGNDHKIIQNDNTNKHNWILYVKSEEKINPLVFFKKITYKLHPSFGNCDKEMKLPFRDSYIGWGTFEIPIVIQFRDWMKCEDLEVKHELSFDEEGDFCRFFVSVSKNDWEKIEKFQNKN